jgi:ubiquinone/menaquinone biosynthesis C-methylase UbiE
MKSYTELAIRRHDIDADYFQQVYSKDEKDFTLRETVFLHGRRLVLRELEIVLSQLPVGSKILDVGCGTAHLTNWIRKKGYEVYGIEPSKEMYQYAVSNFPDIEIRNAISSQIPYGDNQFDLIVAFEVLRYLGEDENRKTYKEFHRVLKPDGQFFVTQVNTFSTDLYFFFYHLKEWYSRITKRIHHHCNFTTAQKEKRRARQAGFQKVQTIGVFAGSIRLAYKFGRNFGNFYSAFHRKISRKDRHADSFMKNLSAHLIVIGRK